MKAPSEAVEYYGLDPNKAMVRDVILSIRADEAVHRSVNHHFSDIPQFYEVHNDKVQISNGSFRIEDIDKPKMIANTEAGEHGEKAEFDIDSLK